MPHQPTASSQGRLGSDYSTSSMLIHKDYAPLLSFGAIVKDSLTGLPIEDVILYVTDKYLNKECDPAAELARSTASGHVQARFMVFEIGGFERFVFMKEGYSLKRVSIPISRDREQSIDLGEVFMERAK